MQRPKTKRSVNEGLHAEKRVSGKSEHDTETLQEAQIKLINQKSYFLIKMALFDVLFISAYAVSNLFHFK